jgi:hypothetical protein
MAGEWGAGEVIAVANLGSGTVNPQDLIRSQFFSNREPNIPAHGGGIHPSW